MAKKRTKIVCTMGPATESDDVLRELIKSGMNVARFNFSHGTHAYHRKNIDRVRAISRELGIPVAILLDTKGPEVRTGMVADGGKAEIETGSHVVVTTREAECTAEVISIDYANLPQEVELGSTILIDDGLIELSVESVDGQDIHCLVKGGGELGEHKGVNLPNVEVGLPAVTDQDRADIMFGCELGIDAIAASFVRNAAAVDEIREICHKMGRFDIDIFPKIESAIGVRNFDEILAAADGIMVARGDLGVEVPPQRVPHIQKEIIRKCGKAYKPVIVATQMLDSMIRNPRPTRAEVTDVANAIYDGTDCVMLSGETAAGAYPVEAVRTMAAICKESEKYLATRHKFNERGGVKNVNSSVGYAAVMMAEQVKAKCILCPTHTGRTARLVSNFRPKLPIYATSPNERAATRTCFYWGVFTYRSTEQGTLQATLYDSLTVAKANGLVESGDIVVITAGDAQTSPRTGDYTTSTNMAMVAQVQ